MKTIKVNNLLVVPNNYTGIVENLSGDKHWYLNGKLHREDGPAVECANGTKFWYLNDKLHREDGPAIEDNGNKYWYLYNILGREDGPAVEYADGTKSWFHNSVELNGNRIQELLDLGYPVKTAIKLMHFYETQNLE